MCQHIGIFCNPEKSEKRNIFQKNWLDDSANEMSLINNLIMKFLKYLTFIIASSLIFFGCDQSSDTDFGTLRVLLTDAPGNYDAVYVDVQEVRIHKSSDAEDGDSGWITINTEPMVVDLLELTNGRYEILGEEELEPGRYNQLRLILGDQNEVVIDGQSHALTTPSGQQSGLKLQIDADIEGGQIYTLLLDFDASRSIVQAGASGNILLKPVIRTAWLEQTGTISGSIEPSTSLPWVYAIAGADTVAGTRAAENGDFQIIGLASGTYQVSVIPSEDGYTPVVLSDVEVNAPDETDVGTIQVDTE